MNDMKISVIVPVYQAEKTLERCLDSLIKQQDDDIEIILINDGSTDNSADICRAFAERYQFIHYYSKDNGGVSSARNLGLDHASGDYVVFVDSDDYVLDKYFDNIRDGLKKKPDLLLFKYTCFGKSEKDSLGSDFYYDKIEDTSDTISILLENNSFNSLCNKAFKRNLIEQRKLEFFEDLQIAEDLTFIVSYLCEVHSVCSITKYLYCVDISNQESLSRKTREHLDDQLLTACRYMLRAIDSADMNQVARNNYYRALSWLYYRSVYSYAREVQKIGWTSKARVMAIKKACIKYSQDKVRSADIKGWLLALPVRMKMAWTLDFIARCYAN